MEEGYEVSKSEPKYVKGGEPGEVETHNYAGPHPLGSPEDVGAEKHAHIVVNEKGEVTKARDVGESKMTKY